MNREDLNELIAAGPVRIGLDNGSTIELDSSENALIGDLDASVLVRDNDGKLRHRFFSLKRIARVDRLKGNGRR